MSDVNRRLAVSREPDRQENNMRDQRYAEGDRHPLGPHARTFSRPDDSRREVDPYREGENRDDNGHGAWRAGGCNPEPEERDVPGHEGREDLTQGKEADRVDSSGRSGQRVEQQVANRKVDRLMMDLSCDFGLHDVNRPLAQPPTTGVLLTGIFASRDSSMFRCARTSSWGVNANH